MTTYTKRDLRAVDRLSLFLCSVGIVLTLCAVVSLVTSSSGRRTTLLWIAALSLLCLGTALNLKVRQIVRHKGEEPKELDGVPE